jgi:hypothetical protein
LNKALPCSGNPARRFDSSVFCENRRLATPAAPSVYDFTKKVLIFTNPASLFMKNI